MFVKGVEENRAEGKAEPWSFLMNSYVNCESFGAQVVLRVAPVAGEAPSLPCLCMSSLWKWNKEWYCALFLFLDTLPGSWYARAVFWPHSKNLHCGEWKPWVSECPVDMGVVISRTITIPMGKQQSLTHRVQLRQIPNHLSGPHTDADRKYPP